MDYCIVGMYMHNLTKLIHNIPSHEHSAHNNIKMDMDIERHSYKFKVN